MKAKPIIVCAAMRRNYHIVCGARHWDSVMSNQVEAYSAASDAPSKMWEQGFIDQYGKFYNREEAMKVVKESGQPFNAERNGHPEDQLFSEGLY